MRKLAHALSLTFLTAIASPPLLADEDTKACAMYADMAKNIMEGRQGGISMAEMMEIAGKSDIIKDISEEMVIQAYEYPRYNTERYKRRTAEDFRDQWYLICIKARRAE